MNGLIGKKFPVLDQGHVILLAVMGDDAAIADAARTSYGKGTRTVSDDRTLIRYLLRHGHTSPFEMAEIKIHVRVPMDTWRQWIRHRTANVSEYSTRYSEAIDAMHATEPGEWRLQATDNKQGSGEAVVSWPEGYDSTISRPDDWSTPGKYLSDMERHTQSVARQVYEERLRFGVAREQARKDLPLSTYTEMIWKCDLHNVLHFLRLRLDDHAQLEIRQYARAIAEIVEELFPLTWEAFTDYQLGAVTLTSLDAIAVRSITGGINVDEVLTNVFDNKREREECRMKLDRLEITTPHPKV